MINRFQFYFNLAFNFKLRRYTMGGTSIASSLSYLDNGVDE
jgi:hypothetical protein